MSNTIVIGAQWGDEGKGKVIDFLTEKSDVIVRCQGGNNAGHTVIHEDQSVVLHLIPSGILWADKLCVIGNGVVVDPLKFIEEIEGLREKGVEVSPENLRIHPGAHVVLPHHIALDGHREGGEGSARIGTTRRGIGPTYGDKANRIGVRLLDLLKNDFFQARWEELRRGLEPILSPEEHEALNDPSAIEAYLEAGRTLQPFMVNTVEFLHRQMKAGKKILFEGAQGSFLDIDHGCYPFVTASNTTAGGACTGSGVPPHRIDTVIGVTKAYTTRVGEGPFITEDEGLGKYFHGLGREFGATTGRARRCGWLDGVLLRYAAMINGFDRLALTNLDGLDGMKTIRLCVAYACDGKRYEIPPVDTELWELCEPIYEEFPGWEQSLVGVEKWEQLPSQAQNFLARVEEVAAAPISHVGVGPMRHQTLVRD